MKKPSKSDRDKKKAPKRSPAGGSEKPKENNELTDEELGKVSGGVSELGVKDHSI